MNNAPTGTPIRKGKVTANTPIRIGKATRDPVADSLPLDPSDHR